MVPVFFLKEVERKTTEILPNTNHWEKNLQNHDDFFNRKQQYFQFSTCQEVFPPNLAELFSSRWAFWGEFLLSIGTVFRLHPEVFASLGDFIDFIETCDHTTYLLFKDRKKTCKPLWDGETNNSRYKKSGYLLNQLVFAPYV